MFFWAFHLQIIPLLPSTHVICSFLLLSNICLNKYTTICLPILPSIFPVMYSYDDTREHSFTCSTWSFFCGCWEWILGFMHTRLVIYHWTSPWVPIMTRIFVYAFWLASTLISPGNMIKSGVIKSYGRHMFSFSNSHQIVIQRSGIGSTYTMIAVLVP